MEDRQFTEMDLRSMLKAAGDYRRGPIAGRFIVETRHKGRRWEVVVEPDLDIELLVVVTAYPVD
jgi:hypothetical protein